METNSIIRFNGDNTSFKSHFEKMNMDLKEEEISYDLKESMNENQSKINESGNVDKLLHVMNAVPKENISVSSKVLSVPEKIEPDSGDEPSKYPELNQKSFNFLNSSINSDVLPNDLSPKPKHICVTDKIRLCIKNIGNNDHNVSYTNVYTKPVQNFKKECLETPINRIPKDVLGNYGIVIEEYECYSVGPDNGMESDEDFEDSRKLVIDEGKDGQKNDESSENELSGEKSESTLSDLSVKENTWGLDDSGRHLVISSVMSLQNKLCSKCDEVLPNATSLIKHQSKHCSFSGCPEIIEKESDREKHMQIHKDHPVKPFRCDICRKRFHYYRFAQKHKEICKILKRSKCPYCKYASSKVGQFNKHIAKHINNITCTECKKKYTLVKKFSKHMYVHHNKQVVFQCTECPRRFQVPETIISHIAVHDLDISDCGMARFIRVQNIDQA